MTVYCRIVTCMPWIPAHFTDQDWDVIGNSQNFLKLCEKASGVLSMLSRNGRAMRLRWEQHVFRRRFNSSTVASLRHLEEIEESVIPVDYLDFQSLDLLEKVSECSLCLCGRIAYKPQKSNNWQSNNKQEQPQRQEYSNSPNCRDQYISFYVLSIWYDVPDWRRCQYAFQSGSGADKGPDSICITGLFSGLVYLPR